MDSVTATHVVAAVLATSHELMSLWRRMIGAGQSVSLSGNIVAIAWNSCAGRRIRATARAQQIDLATLARGLELRPDCSFVLVEHRKRTKIVVLQKRADLAAGRLIEASGADSPLVVTYRPDCEQPPGVERAAGG